MSARHGVTLIELLVTLSIMAVISAVTVMAARRIEKPKSNDPRVIIAESLRVALATGRTAIVRIVVDGVAVSATIRPDGSIIADSALHIERLTAEPTHAP